MNLAYALNDKFSAAKLPDICAPRHALVRLFNKHSDRRVIYVSAPAGSGKTVSTQLWLKGSGRTPLWIALDEYDNVPSIFYKLFCMGIQSLQPDNKVMSDIMSSPSFAASPVEHTIHLLSEFAPDDRKYAIVFDDMHLVSNREIRKTGLLVQKRLPSSFIAVVLTRNEIAEEYISITGKERCAVITAQELAFSTDEIQKYFSAHGHFITENEAAAAYGLTNGWSIGVNAMVMSGQIEMGQDGSHALDNYIKTQIWDKWDKELQDFMLKTSAVDEMSVELCERLTGRKDARDILDGLSAKNVFVSKTSDDNYHYHHLFRDFLRNILEQNAEIHIEVIYKTAAGYYLERRQHFQARRFATKSGDSESIVNANFGFYNVERSSAVDESIDFYQSFFKEEMLESVCMQHPYIYCQYAWYYYLMGDADRMEVYLDKFYGNFPAIARDHPQFLENSILIAALDPRVSFAQQIDRFESLPIVPYLNSQKQEGGKIQGSTISMQLPYAHRTLRDYSELMSHAVMEKFANSFGRLLRMQYDVIMLELRSGFMYERNMLNEALEAALQTINAINSQTRDEVIFCAYTHLASIYHATGEGKLLADVIRQTEKYIESEGAYQFKRNFAAFKTKLRLLDGDMAAAREWFENYFVVETEGLELYKVFQHFTTARAHMLLGQADKARYYIAGLKKLGTDFRRTLDIAEAGVLQAALEWATGSRNEALRTMEGTLAAIQEYGYVRIVADEGAAVLPILKKLTAVLKKREAAGALSIHYLNEVTAAAYKQSGRHKGIIAVMPSRKLLKLSKQQSRIISLMSRGYKNADIVDLTSLTIHTVKSHQTAAYAKLGVNNAMDAVLKAKELGLIE